MQLCAFCYAFVAFVAILFNSHSLSVVSLTLNIINAICSFCSLCTSAQKYSISKFMEQNEKSWPRKSNTFVCKSSVCKMVCFSNVLTRSLRIHANYQRHASSILASNLCHFTWLREKSSDRTSRTNGIKWMRALALSCYALIQWQIYS